jgi:hypothetical protein
MPRPTCYTSSSIGSAPDLHKNFLERVEPVSIYWDDSKFVDDGAFLKVFHHCEPPEVMPGIADRIIENQKFFDVIMTYDPRVLQSCPNAVFLTESSCSWIDRKAGGSPAPFIHSFPDGPAALSPIVPNYQGCNVSGKHFSASFLTSSKGSLPGHQLRQELFNKLPENVGSMKIWKHRSPPRIDDKRPTLEPYMFSIVAENSRHAGYYTEKIVDCFVAKTIPIYWGCPSISEHFNMGGILKFETYEGLMCMLRDLGPELYASMLSSIEENFNKALLGVHQWDLIEQYITNGIASKHSDIDSGKRHGHTPPSSNSDTQQISRPIRWASRKP